MESSRSFVRLPGWLALVFLLCAGQALAQIPRDSQITGPLDFDTRNLAMGSAGVSDIENTGSMFSNPATLSFLRHPGVMAAHHHN